MTSTSVRAILWRARAADWWSTAWRWVLLAAGAVLAVYFVLDRAVSNGIFVASAIGALVVGAVLTFSKPMAIALMAMPAMFIVQRVSLGGGDLSVSDVALAAAFGTAVLLGERPFSMPMRSLLWLNLGYQFATLFTVIANPDLQNTAEWFHAWLLVSGALVVGWSVGRAGHASLAFRLMVGAAVVLAIGTVITGIFQYAAGNFGSVYPSWPWGVHKNAAGTLMAFVVMILFVNPPWGQISERWARPAMWFLVLAVAMTQSRQALIGLIVGIIVVTIRRGAVRSPLLVLLIVPAIWLIVITVNDQVESQNNYNSFFQRVNWFREVYAFWKHSPFFGHGLRFWYYNPTVPYQPPQAELEVVASSGIVGLAGFLVMWAGILIVLWRLSPAYGTLAFVVTLGRLVQGQFDLFWVTAQVSVPFVIAGICVGALARHQADDASRLGDPVFREGALPRSPLRQ